MARGEAEKLVSILRRMSEEGLTSFFNEVMSNDALRRGLGRAGTRFIDNKGRFDRSVETLLDFVNVPSKRDIRELKARLDHLNGQLLNLNIKLDRMVNEEDKGAAAAPQTHGQESRAALRRNSSAVSAPFEV